MSEAIFSTPVTLVDPTLTVAGGGEDAFARVAGPRSGGAPGRSDGARGAASQIRPSLPRDLWRVLDAYDNGHLEFAQGCFRLTLRSVAEPFVELAFTIWESRPRGWTPIVSGTARGDRLTIAMCAFPAAPDNVETLARFILAGTPAAAASDATAPRRRPEITGSDR